MEQTLAIVHRHVQAGMVFNLTGICTLYFYILTYGIKIRVLYTPCNLVISFTWRWFRSQNLCCYIIWIIIFILFLWQSSHCCSNWTVIIKPYFFLLLRKRVLEIGHANYWILPLKIISRVGRQNCRILFLSYRMSI